MRELLAVGCGGFVGAVLRWGTHAFLQRVAPAFPLGTLTVNVLGCFVLGFLASAWAAARTEPGPRELFLSAGLLGAFTTFSTFGVETFALLREGETRTALLSVAANLGLGLVAVMAGHLVARAAA